MESKRFKLSRTEAKYLECKFIDITYKANVKVRVDTQVISKRGSFMYHGSFILGNEEINNEVTLCIGAGWMKKRLTSSVV